MDLSKAFCCSILVILIASYTDAWSGNVCQRTVRYAYRYTYCACRIWWGCLYYRSLLRFRYSINTYCCPGWRHNGDTNCNIPICSPQCQNGGTCIRPNTCDCAAGYDGPICTGVEACSHRSPCYPGRCSNTGTCMCSDKFTGNTCLSIVKGEDTIPEISKVNATFAYYSYTKNQFAYDFMTDATGMTEVDFVWMNQDEFNILKFDIDARVESEYTFQHIPQLPNYVREVKFGIVDARINVEHRKLGSSGEYVANTDVFVCPGPSSTNPIANTLFQCRLHNATNIIQIDSGDKYQLTFTVTTGGYRVLINPDTNIVYQRDTYNTVFSKNVMEYRFDYDVPVHCAEFKNCTGDDVPLKLEKSVTKEPIKSFWKGWYDRNLSGVARYVVEFWKMEYSSDYDGLREPDILLNFNPVPQYIIQITANETIDYPIYEPTEPGVYSVILEVADMANNSRYARRIAIFDKESNISINSQHRMYVLSASPESNYYWQTTPNSGNSATVTITLSWYKHFVNNPHEQGHFLKKILPYTPRLSDNIRRDDYKRIDPGFDDNQRRNSTPNLNSIIKFETVHGTKSSTPPSGWQQMPLKENATFTLTGVNIRDGDSYQVWVRAHDIMGNTKVDSAVVRFDHSPPNIFTPKFQPNVKSGSFPFSSRVTVSGKDEQSGLSKVSFKFVKNSTGEVTEQREFTKSIESKENCDNKPKECYCISDEECFMIDTVLEINNCWLKVPIHKVQNEVHLLEITIYNLAMLSAKTIFNMGMVDTLQGVREYYSPSNITIHKTTDTSLSISWVQAPSCYERASILIRLFRPDNTTRDFKVHRDATTFDLTGLSATTKYWFQLYTRYGNDSDSILSASPAVLEFTTTEKQTGIQPGTIGSVTGGFIILIIVIVVVLVFLGRTGRLQPAKAKMTQGIRTIRNTVRVRNTRSHRGYNNRAYSTKFDDDIYYYGQMDVKRDNSLVLSRKDISLESQLAEGRFATIYIAKLYSSREVQTVVAKVLKDDQNEENVMKMKAKINFFVEKVGQHKNVLQFMGSVEDDVRGPFMVLEYCERGVLKDFLISCRDNVTVDLEEKLFRMVFGICTGMDYLSSRQVVHRRLAARNILLNALYEPKIAGFGPDPTGEVDEDERIPLKWMAPECMKTTRHANELSDAYSFGIVMWEVFSLGETPYPGFQSRDVPSKQKQGYKMKKPEYCDDAFYKLMLKCWHYDPNKRAGFNELKNDLTNLFQEGPGEEYYYRSNDF